ncbi:MAG: Crp/Fnr family transcriptional regulator [Anaerosomatales bacterium]|nr:Crp/Fnr family transcriptional regulator [Anaerosomatales bacterium]
MSKSAAGKLAAFPLFSTLPMADLEELAGMLRSRRYSKGVFVASRGEPCTAMYLLASGRVKQTIPSPDGKELVLGHLDAPAHFGEASLVEMQHHMADVVALSETEVLTLDARELERAIHIQPRLALSLIAALSSRLREAVERLESLTFHDAAHRVMRVLLNIASARHSMTGASAISGFTHYDIATLAGTSRETASRVISSLTRDGIIAVRGRTILVDVEKLRAELVVR